MKKRVRSFWLLSRNEYVPYDEIRAAVVCAFTEAQARSVMGRDWEDPKFASCRKVSTAKTIAVLEDFKAG